MEGAPPSQQKTPAPARTRYRVRFGKDGPLRYTSHLDLARLWERLLRRAGVPLVYSQGFNPRPRLQLAAALPLGYASTCELMDMWLEGENLPTPEELLPRLRATAPEGLTVDSIWPVDLRERSLQSRARAATYRATISEDTERETLERRIAALLEREEVWRERRGKRHDIRPLLHSLRLLPGEPLTLHMELSLSQEKGTLRPDEVLAELGLDPLRARITRTAITFDPS